MLAKELEQLGATSIDVQRRLVNCEGDRETLYKLCYRSRFAVNTLSITALTMPITAYFKKLTVIFIVVIFSE